MTRLYPLPRIMVAPNGARLGKADHPALPVTIAEIVDTAAACHAAGAGAIHAHVRDRAGNHVLDAGLYRELIEEVGRAVPDIPVQITTESAGRYEAAAQRALLRSVRPEGVSIALTEMLSDGDQAAARRSYHELSEAGVAVQHILYDRSQLDLLRTEIAAGTIPRHPFSVLFVLGRYADRQVATPAMLQPFLDGGGEDSLDWAVCAFGPAETACLRQASRLGGKLRVGFENNLLMENGETAPDNAARVAEIARMISAA